MARFDLAIGGLLRREGGLVNHPDDPGGLTNFGISKRAYPGIDIAALTPDSAAAIYYSDYWMPLRCDEINAQQVASGLFDAAVNMGKTTAVKLLQRIISTEPDGVMGDKTLAAVNAREAGWLTMKYGLARIERYASLAENQKLRGFFLGWVRRTLEVLNA